MTDARIAVARANELEFKMSELKLSDPDMFSSDLVVDAIKDIENSARMLVATAYVGPSLKLQECGVCSIAVGTVWFCELVEALDNLQQLSDYYHTPVRLPEDFEVEGG